MSLDLVAVSHRYAGRAEPVLRDVSLRIAPGESVALMGPSGSGKTTLLAILGLLTSPTSGGVVLDGQAIGRRQAGRMRAASFGWVFQGTNVLGRRSALENASLGLLAKGVARDEAEERGMTALVGVGLGELAFARANTLSGGELQRVCIARALAAEPRFILADEPTGQLDSTTTAGVIEALVSLRPAATAVVIATHDPDVAAHCDRLIRLRDGAIEAGG